MKIVKLIFITLMISTTLVYAGVKETDKGVKFFWEAADAEEVYVVGSFNSWNTSADKMQQDENGVWHKTIELPPGEHTYKFFVDGNWRADEGNPQTKPDGYGGTNSLVLVGESKTTSSQENVQKPLTESVKTTLNPKVSFNGRYYTKAISKETDIGRYMLDKPDHDINLQVNFNLNSNMKAYTVMNINNITENVDMWKTHLNFKRTLLSMNTQYFAVNAFDGVGFIKFGDPLHLVGDVGQYNYNFGYDHTGVFTDSKIPALNCPFTHKEIHLKFKGLIADESGDNNSDVKAGRITVQPDVIPSSQIRFGYGSYLYQTPIDGTSSQENSSSEFDLQFSHKWENENWINPLQFKLMAEYYTAENNTVDSLTTNWFEGNTTLLGIGIEFPAALQVSSSFKHIYLDLTEELKRNSFKLTADYNYGEISVEAGMNYWTTDFPDSNLSWSDYYTYLEKTDGNGRWYQKYSDLTFDRYTLLGYDSGFLWNFDLCYKNKLWQRDYELTYQSNIAQRQIQNAPRFIENTFTLKFDFAKNWRFSSNTRLPYYNDQFLDIETDFSNGKDLFVSTFAQVTYYLRENIELSLGWGVNPRILNATTDEFYQGGREEYLEEQGDLTNYLKNNYKGLGEKLRKAEHALEDANRIGLEAVLKF